MNVVTVEQTILFQVPIMVLLLKDSTNNNLKPQDTLRTYSQLLFEIWCMLEYTWGRDSIYAGQITFLIPRGPFDVGV